MLSLHAEDRWTIQRIQTVLVDILTQTQSIKKQRARNYSTISKSSGLSKSHPKRTSCATITHELHLAGINTNSPLSSTLSTDKKRSLQKPKSRTINYKSLIN